MTWRAFLALPGIVVHELGHYLFCRLCGVSVREVVFFEAAGPGGHVVHSIPNRLFQHATIVGGPLLLNSSLAFLLFRAAFADLSLVVAGLADDPFTSAVRASLALFFGLSIGIQAIPSHADAASLWMVTLDHLRQGRLLAVLAVPPALLLLLVNVLRRFWIDWLYLASLAVVAWILPGK